LRMEVVQSLPSLLDVRRLRIVKPSSHRAARLVFRNGDSSLEARAVQDRHCLLLSDYVMGQGGREAKILGLV
jgi:hypothetical protein